MSKADKIALYTKMARIRHFEQRCIRIYQQGKIGGFLHLYVGQEAVAAGTISLLGKHDHIITGYRDHGHGLMVGMGMNECMAELTGRVTGCSQGKGGSMHYFAPDKNYWGGHGIVGGQAPLGTGLAYAVKYMGLKGSCLVYMGDGAVNQGAVHEAYNLAMGTSQERSTAHPGCLAKRAEGYNMAWDVINGHDVYEVRAKTAIALKRAHEESKPTVLEIFTYRYFGHSMADPDKTYRDKEEIKEYREKKDPVLAFEQELLSEKVLTPELSLKINEAAMAEADKAALFADESPDPTVADITKHIYWEEDNRGPKTTSRGTIIFE
ncbi:MAG: pyruvate dehydrogenase (acetyl-transferring) E1 component subunit alpha [Opitutia bacterium AMD-G1]|nr:MAG: pyruvate dehydrogenase (acetyl-transferring) E1 component subunit alpha [Opitutae bacterium AMD-G1]